MVRRVSLAWDRGLLVGTLRRRDHDRGTRTVLTVHPDHDCANLDAAMGDLSECDDSLRRAPGDDGIQRISDSGLAIYASRFLSGSGPSSESRSMLAAETRNFSPTVVTHTSAPAASSEALGTIGLGFRSGLNTGGTARSILVLGLQGWEHFHGPAPCHWRSASQARQAVP